MATMSDDTPLFDDANGAPTGNDAHNGDAVDVLEQKNAAGTNEPWTKVRLKDVDGQPTGWVPSALVSAAEAPPIAIKPDDFAAECMRQSLRFGVNAHYLLGVAQLRSKISNDTVGTEVGPFRYSQAEWDIDRIDTALELRFEAHDIRDWRSQCAVSAHRAYRDQEAIMRLRNGERPSAVELYLTRIVGAKTAAAVVQTPASKIDALLAAAAADELPGGAGTADQIIARNEKLLKKNNAPATGAEIIDQIAAALQEAIDTTRALAIKAGATALEDGGAPTTPDSSPKAILLRRTTVAGAAPVMGHLVEKMQKALIQSGKLPATDAAGKPNDDGRFGPKTEDALKAWQTANQFEATGALTAEQWTKLTTEPLPEIYERCAQLTAAFEGTNFGGVNPIDTDNTVVTFGYHGYTLTGGNLQKFLKQFDGKFPGLLEATFGADKAAQLKTLFPPVPLAQAIQNGKGIFLSGNAVKQEWRDAFKAFGESKEGKAEQLAFSKATYWADGQALCAKMKLSEPLSQALCFDVAIQNGPKLNVAAETVTKFISTMGEREKRQLFAEAIVKEAKPQFQADVRSRKVDTLGDGSGKVHDGEYRLVDWGFGSGEGSEADGPAGGGSPPSNNLDFNAFFAQKLPGVTAFTPGDFLVKGAKHAINHLNTDPPVSLWPNVVELVRVLIELKTRVGNSQITFNSVYRSPKYNASVGGAGGSVHMQFRAADIVVHNGQGPRDWARVLSKMRNEGVFKGGIGVYGSFVHVDTRGFNADWNG